MRAAVKPLSGLLLAVALSACSVFNPSNAPKPAPLEAVASAGAERVVWSLKQDGLQFPLSIATAGQQFIVASSDGVVQSLQADSGALLWRGESGAKLNAGVGSDGRFAAVVTRNNELVVLDAGQPVWRKTLTSTVRAAPLVAGERVFVLTVDRQVLAFDALDGRRLWDLRRPGDPLTLLQPGVIAAYKDTLVVGQGARLAGVDPLRGTLRWEASVANPRGTNEVERLADLVGPLLRQGEILCARAFQSAVGCVNAERGSALWSRNTGGTQGVGGDAQFVFGADGSDRLTAWKIANGDVAWTAEQFLNRKLSAPLSIGSSLLIGDFEGYVHIIARDTGKTRARLATDGSPIVAAPVALGGTVLVATRNGGLFAIKPE
ncbi:outer membrane protein assembly factor BamB [Paucibacter sp. XJ19-41]|uniref:outer membrane protein assembly factor BamB n=1 Tax=Paucibacter sp. XJ19-41 TaxID=2927824 RepID=UPI00234927E0|nr:outer membrane protein assembly factor BamB [Paucibacter sp. XJ19-41]MDC6170090.1 outer membrane protein assembly factor BamB [Paucibacter sp. XJ19-41]